MYHTAEVLMDSPDFKLLLGTYGVNAKSFESSQPEVFAAMANNWRWSHVFLKDMAKWFIGVGLARPFTPDESLILRQISAAHKIFRYGVAKTASNEILRLISEAAASKAERDQMPVTAAMVGILREVHASLAADNLTALALMRSNAIDFNQKDRDGLTPLAVAAQAGSDKCLFALCKNGANPHLTDSMGNSPLHWACAMKSSKALSVLLYYGANVNSVNDGGVTPLMLACAKSNKDIVQKLLDYGADLRMKDRRGNTVLHKTVSAKNAEIAKFLIDSGADQEEPNTDGHTPWGLALKLPELLNIFSKT